MNNLEVGKTYVTRDGEDEGYVLRSFECGRYFEVKINGRFLAYFNNGRAEILKEHPKDLIALADKDSE